MAAVVEQGEDRIGPDGPLDSPPAGLLTGAQPQESPPERVGALVRDLIEAVALAAVLFVGLQLVVQNTVVDGNSMVPNFADGQRLLVNKLAYRWSVPRRGDVIVFHAPSGNGEDFIKRVVALPGEEVEIHDGTVFVNGRPLAEPWSPRRDHSAFPAYQVTSGHVFVLGDNRADSNDSRTWGEALATDRIVGRAWLSVWPLDRLGLIRSDGIRTVAAEGPSR